MGRLVARLAATGCAAAIVAGAAPVWAVAPIGSRSLVVTVSPARAGARPASLTLTFSYMMQCGYPGPGPVRILLPGAEGVPTSLARSAVLVDGHGALAVALSGHTVTVSLAPMPRIICDVIGEGRLVIELTAAANFANPSRAGTYTVTATNSASPSGAFSARFTLRAA